jgi:hypothetical protein
MANYNKSTNFTAKDTLPTGNAGKIVKGAEIDTEFTAVANAIASKADINSANLTGTPTAPTAGVGSNTTQLANTAFVKAEITALALGNMSIQNKTAVDITGGTITGITDLAVADGGTGRSTLAANAVLVGNGTSGINTIAPSTSGNILKSDGTSWASVSLKGLGLGGEVWNTPSRAFNTTYTNSNAYPIMVMVSIFQTVNGPGTLVYINGTEFARAGTNSNSNLYPVFTFIVPPSATYNVTNTGGTLNTWSELY